MGDRVVVRTERSPAMTTTPIEYGIATRTRQGVPIRRLLTAGLSAAIVGVVVVEVYAALVKAAGVPMSAGFLGATHATPVAAGSFAMGVLVCTFWGTILSAVLSKLSRRPRRTFLFTSCTLAALSLVVPFGAGATATSTKLALAGAHVIVASVVIPILARALSREAQDVR
jgi:hypothetical protein